MHSGRPGHGTLLCFSEEGSDLPCLHTIGATATHDKPHSHDTGQASHRPAPKWSAPVSLVTYYTKKNKTSAMIAATRPHFRWTIFAFNVQSIKRPQGASGLAEPRCHASHASTLLYLVVYLGRPCAWGTILVRPSRVCKMVSRVCFLFEADHVRRFT